MKETKGIRHEKFSLWSRVNSYVEKSAHILKCTFSF